MCSSEFPYTGISKSCFGKGNGRCAGGMFVFRRTGRVDNGKTLSKGKTVRKKEYSNAMFRWARQFSEADVIVLAAPYWDLMFPAKVRAYLEEVTVAGITFQYNEDGIPQGLCKAKRLLYVTTAGGPIIYNFGFEYVKALAQGFFGISDVQMFKAEGLDIQGADVNQIMERAKNEITA